VGFRFRYAALLDYRRHLKEQAEIKLSRARHRLMRSRDALKKERERLGEAKDYFDAGLKSRIPSQELQGHCDYIASLTGKIGERELDVAEREKTVRERMKDLLEKTKKHKVVEKLKERDFQEWQHQQNLIEQKMMNDVAVTRHGREFL
jgi:flagellar FliJ protein